MQKKLSFLSSLLILILVLLTSCRPDLLVEQDARNQAEQSGLTSKIISLNESAHKYKILPELKFAKETLSKKSANLFGKNVNFGDSISIDTENVIYIENGPNFHTYTFKIDRTNSQLNDLVENLLLSLQPDNTYKEYLVSYNITNQEKQALENGTWLIPKDKIKMTEIAAGTLNNGQLAKALNCVWTTVFVGYTTCSANMHWHGEGADQCNAAASGGGSEAVYASYWDCVEEVYETITLPPTDSGGGGAGSTGGSDPEPDPCVAAASNPGELGLVNGDGCSIGAPTQPNLGGTKSGTPCNKIKKTTDDAKFQAKQVILATKGNALSEIGYALSNPITGTGLTGTQEKLLENYPGTGVLNFSPTNFTFAYIHSHKDSQYPIFSPDDLAALNRWIVGIIAYNSNPNNLIKVDLKELTVSVVTGWGTYLMSFDGTTIDAYPNYTVEEFEILNRDYTKMMIEAGDQYGSNYQNNLETQFLKFTNKYMPMPGMKLFRVRSTGNTEIYLENGNRKTKVCP